MKRIEVFRKTNEKLTLIKDKRIPCTTKKGVPVIFVIRVRVSLFYRTPVKSGSIQIVHGLQELVLTDYFSTFRNFLDKKRW